MNRSSQMLKRATLLAEIDGLRDRLQRAERELAACSSISENPHFDPYSTADLSALATNCDRRATALRDSDSHLRPARGEPFNAEKQVADALRQSEVFFSNVLDSLPSLIAVLDENGIVVMVNRPWLCEASSNDGNLTTVAVGSNYLDVCRRSSEAGDSDAKAALEALEAVRSGQAEHRVLDYFCARPSGCYWYQMHARRLRDGGSGLVVSHIDITERQQVEQALRDSEQRFRAVFEHAGTGIAIYDLDGHLIDCNPAYQALLARPREELYGRSCADILHPEDQAAYLAQIAHLREQQLPFSEMEFRYLKQDGGTVWVRKFVSLLRDANGLPTHLLSLVTDTTERRQMMEALHEADRRKDQFLAVLAHELRNPLAPIRNGLTTLRWKENPNPEVNQIYEMMGRQLNHLIRLVDDLLEASRITRGKIELAREWVNLADLVEHAVETNRILMLARNHELTVSLPREPLRLFADPVRLNQVISNLINNAAKYTEPGGRIAVSVAYQDGEAVLAVEDNGIGIAAEMLPFVFELFAQVDSGFSRTADGLGIGLALARSLVTLHGGELESFSPGLGQGSRFIVRLPNVSVVPDRQQLLPDDSGLVALLQYRIMITDDNPDVADSLALLLESLDAEVLVTYDGNDAIKQLATFKPQVILLDIGMPNMDGYETAKAIRNAPYGSAVKLIALTGWSNEDVRRRSAEAGFDHHLTKPVDIELLKSILIPLCAKA